MIDLDVSIWLGAKTRWAQLTKVFAMPVAPRVGEFMKFKYAVAGD